MSVAIAKILVDRAARALPTTSVSGLGAVIDCDQAACQIDALGALCDRYPEHRHKLKRLIFTREMSSPDVYAEWKGTRLIVSAIPFTQEEWLTATDAHECYFHAADTVNRHVYQMAHEFGHIVAENQPMAKQAQRIVEKSVGRSGARARVAAYEQHLISKYAITNRNELVAEAFATMVTSAETASSVERQIYNILTEGERR